MSLVLDKGYEIAKRALKKCYSSKGILAGKSHFADIWARDSFYACLGAIKLGNFEIVKQNLETFLNYIDEDGRVPLRIGTYDLTWTFITESLLPFLTPEKKEVKARYTNDRNKFPPLDTNPLFLIAFEEYISKTNDLEFAKQNYDKLELIVKRMENDEDEELGLIKNFPASSWDDSLNFNEAFIYTNVCYAKSLESMAKISEKLRKDNTPEILHKYETIKNNINRYFWNGEFYKSIPGKLTDSNVFNSAGNILAVVWDIANHEQAKKIEKAKLKLKINKYIPSLTNRPKYSSEREFNIFKLIGMNDYHNDGMIWTWIGAMDAIAKYKSGFTEEAEKTLENIAKKFIEHNDVLEVYEKTGKPVKRWIYKSENSFAWSASLFIKAYHEIMH